MGVRNNERRVQQKGGGGRRGAKKGARVQKGRKGARVRRCVIRSHREQVGRKKGGKENCQSVCLG